MEPAAADSHAAVLDPRQVRALGHTEPLGPVARGVPAHRLWLFPWQVDPVSGRVRRAPAAGGGGDLPRRGGEPAGHPVRPSRGTPARRLHQSAAFPLDGPPPGGAPGRGRRLVRPGAALGQGPGAGRRRLPHHAVVGAVLAPGREQGRSIRAPSACSTPAPRSPSWCGGRRGRVLRRRGRAAVLRPLPARGHRPAGSADHESESYGPVETCWLTWWRGRPAAASGSATRHAGPRLPREGGWYLHAAHHEVDRSFDQLGFTTDAGVDRWFWQPPQDALTATHPDKPSSQSFAGDITALYDEEEYEARVEVAIQGRTGGGGSATTTRWCTSTGRAPAHGSWRRPTGQDRCRASSTSAVPLRMAEVPQPGAAAGLRRPHQGRPDLVQLVPGHLPPWVRRRSRASWRRARRGRTGGATGSR